MITTWLIEDDTLFRETVADVVDAQDDMACTGQFVTCEEALARLAPDLDAGNAGRIPSPDGETEGQAPDPDGDVVVCASPKTGPLDDSECG